MVLDCCIPDAKRRNDLVPRDHKIQNDVEILSDEPMFSVEELEGIDVIKRGEEFIEVECGCTNNRYGDSVGKLRIYGSGKLEISCDCYPGCNGGMTIITNCFLDWYLIHKVYLIIISV